MIYTETILKVTDNSGAKVVKCIKSLKSGKASFTKLANLFVISVKKRKYTKNIKKGQVLKGILVRGKKNIQRSSGISIKFIDNSLIIIDQKIAPLASRIIGPVYKEIRTKDYPRVIALARNLI